MYILTIYVALECKELNNNSWENLDLNNNAQDSFTLFYNFFVNNFENVFPEKSVEIRTDIHGWLNRY